MATDTSRFGQAAELLSGYPTNVITDIYHLHIWFKTKFLSILGSTIGNTYYTAALFGVLSSFTYIVYDPTVGMLLFARA
jgi:hypothetical protein